MSQDSLNKDISPLQAEVGAPSSEGGGRGQKNWVNWQRIGLAVVRYFASPTKLGELTAAGTMYGIESVYDMRKVAREGNEWGNQYPGLTAENVGQLPEDSNVRAVFDVMGDMWEISVALRV